MFSDSIADDLFVLVVNVKNYRKVLKKCQSFLNKITEEMIKGNISKEELEQKLEFISKFHSRYLESMQDICDHIQTVEQISNGMLFTFCDICLKQLGAKPIPKDRQEEGRKKSEVILHPKGWYKSKRDNIS